MEYLVEGLKVDDIIEAFAPPPNEWDPGGGPCNILWICSCLLFVFN